MKKWETFTDEELKQIVQNSKSFREVALKIGYSANGSGSITIIKDMIEQKHFDTSHFLGQGRNKDQFDYSRFQYGKAIKPANMMDALIALRGRKCECCGLEIWNNQPIPLEIHHLDGDHLNNTLENLQILCCNCHGLTDNFRGKNIKRKNEETISDEEFVKALQCTPNVRQALLKLGLTAKGGNYSRAYNLIEKYGIKQKNI